jgi:hypothetical protein
MSDTNGWPEYKIAVLKQLEYLTERIAALQDLVTKVDKEMVSRPEFASEIKILDDKVASLREWMVRSFIGVLVAVVLMLAKYALAFLTVSRVTP